jgi:hypothetical protein
VRYVETGPQAVSVKMIEDLDHELGDEEDSMRLWYSDGLWPAVA